MLLPLWEGLVRTTPFDSEMAALADRHYSRRTIGARQFCYSGRKLVLRNTEGSILFVWMWPDDAKRMDDQTGYNCAIFRNESERRSSEIILEAEQHAIDKWGQNRFYTYVDPHKIKSANPGYCFKVAGYKFIRVTPSGKHLLVKERNERMQVANSGAEMKRKRGRPRGPHRPILAARVPEEFYKWVLASAAISGRNASEELIWRARQSYEWEAARGLCPYCGSRIEEQNKSPKWQIPVAKVANSKIRE